MEDENKLTLSVEDMEGYQCTCNLKKYEPHTCPYSEEIYGGTEECICCPYCEGRCQDDI